MVQFHLHNPFHRHKGRVAPDEKHEDVPDTPRRSLLKTSPGLRLLNKNKERPHSRKRLAAFWRWHSLDQKKESGPKGRWQQTGFRVAAVASTRNAAGESVPPEEMVAALQEREKLVADREARLERLLQDARIQSMSMEEVRGVLGSKEDALQGQMSRLSAGRQSVIESMTAARSALDATREHQDGVREAMTAVASADRAVLHAGEWGAALAAVQEAADEPEPMRGGEGEGYKEDKEARLLEAVIAGLQPPECGVHRAIVLRLHHEHHGQLYVAGARSLIRFLFFFQSWRYVAGSHWRG